MDAFFGHYVAISGNYAILSDHTKDQGYIFKRNENGEWTENDILTCATIPVSALYSWVVDIEGDFAALGNYPISSDGYVVIYKKDKMDHFKEHQILGPYPSSYFGYSISMYEDYMAVGDFINSGGKGIVHIFKRNEQENYVLQQSIKPAIQGNSDKFGYSVSIHDGIIVVGAYTANDSEGKAYVFRRNEQDTWEEETELSEANSKYYGHSVSIFSIDGNAFVSVGTDKTTSTQGGTYVYHYNRDKKIWKKENKLEASDGINGNEFGYEVELFCNTEVICFLIIGARSDDIGTTNSAGSAYLFKRNENGIWEEKIKFQKDFPTSSGHMGSSVGITNTSIIVGTDNDETSFVYTYCSNLDCLNGGEVDLFCEKCENCNQGYYGDNCDHFDCFGVPDTSSTVCKGNGNCISLNECLCFNQSEFGGDNCDIWKCADLQDISNAEWIYDKDQDSCITRCIDGTISIGDSCLDSILFVGMAIGTTGIGIIIIITLIIIILVIFLLCRKANRFSHIQGIDMIAKEMELEQSENKNQSITPKINLNKSSVIIDSNEIELKKVIGQSLNTVFLAEWKGRKCAYKGFRINKNFGTTFNEDNNSFEEFEKEVEICVNVNHPSILQFYGACINPPKIGILLEFCENGDLSNFLKNKENYSIKNKIRILEEIVSGMYYLHDRSILHRDLKPENILVDGKEHAKIMDFGLSKFKTKISGENEKTMTKQIGTSYYMSPEIIKGGKYSFPTDVYSWAILAFVIITEKFSPYGDIGDQKLFGKIMSDPSFRPEIIEKDFEECTKLITLIKRNWDIDPKNRDTFKEIGEYLKKL